MFTNSRRALMRITIATSALALFSSASFAQPSEGTPMNDLHPGKNAVTIEANGETIAANIFLPTDYDGGKLPTVVFPHRQLVLKNRPSAFMPKSWRRKGF
ncbi:MAG: hypothetical protein R3E95_19515 [Thiolinea sp.]